LEECTRAHVDPFHSARVESRRRRNGFAITPNLNDDETIAGVRALALLGSLGPTAAAALGQAIGTTEEISTLL